MEEFVRVAGMQWPFETSFEEAKGEVRLDQHEVRGWVGRYRHVTVALPAYAFLAVTRAYATPYRQAEKGGPAAHSKTHPCDSP